MVACVLVVLSGCGAETQGSASSPTFAAIPTTTPTTTAPTTTELPATSTTANPPSSPRPVAPAGSVACSPAYPDFCVPPSPPDLDCPDVAPHKRFTVLAPDPHRFDSDGDGIGCER